MKKLRKSVRKLAFGADLNEGDPKGKAKKPATLTPDQLSDFSNYAGGADMQDVMAFNKALDSYGLKGADLLYQPYDDDISKGGNNVTGARQDWVSTEARRAISNARRLGIAPEAFSANAKVIFGGDRYGDTVLNNEVFKRQFPNYQEVVGNIYKDRYNKYVPTEEETATTTPSTFATGGIVDGLTKVAPEVLNSLVSLLDGTPSYSAQPIVNASTMRNMSSPYNNMAYGGIHIKKSHEGRFTAYKKRTGQTTEEAMHSKDPHVRAMAVFANNASKWKHAYGGSTGSNVEVEGGEAVQTPDGQLGVVSGPKHEDGGVDANLPDGTKVFSDRLKVEGKSMKARKLDRERRMEKVQKLLSKDYHSQLTKNTAQRTMHNIQREEQQDMALQQAASQIYAPPKEKNTTERESKKYAYGDIVGDDGLPGLSTNVLPIEGMNPIMNSSLGYIDPNIGVNRTTPKPIVKPDTGNYDFTTGDYIGMAGTALGSVLPLMNTINNRKATTPNINRFRGYGHDALDTNDAEQHYLDVSRGNELADIDTDVNSAHIRNNNGASDINTSRALNIATDIAANKSRASTRANFAKSMLGVLSQREELQNMKDYREMSGDTQVDAENKMDTDNYYSNLGSNFSNLATGVEQIGRDFNVRQANNDDNELLGLLTKNGIRIGRDRSGKLKLMNN